MEIYVYKVDAQITEDGTLETLGNEENVGTEPIPLAPEPHSLDYLSAVILNNVGKVKYLNDNSLILAKMSNKEPNKIFRLKQYKLITTIDV